MKSLLRRNSHDNMAILVWALVFLSFIQIPYLLQNSFFALFYRISNICIFVAAIVNFYNYSILKKARHYKLFLLIFCVIIYPFVIRIGNERAITQSMIFSTIVKVNFAFCLYFKNKHFKEKILGLNLVLVTFAVINTITILLYPNGLYASEVYSNNWFLGYKNDMIYYLLLAIIVNGISSIQKIGRYGYSFWIIYGISFLGIFMTESSTSLVILLVIAMLIIFVGRDRIPKWFNLRNVVIVVMLISAGIVLYGIQQYFSFIIEDLLDKDMTMTGRIVIWERAIEVVKEKPIFGYGFMSLEEWQNTLDLFFTSTRLFSHPHNYLLYVLIEGGVVYLSILLYLYTICGKTAKNNIQNVGCRLVIFFYMILLVEGITESLNHFSLFLPFMSILEPLSKQKLEYI